MRMSASRHTLHAALLLAVAFVPTLFASPVSAASVSYDGKCFRSADVIQWKPQKGPAARFIADAFSTTHTGLWIGLGRSGSSFWSAEGGEPSDACDDCRILDLVQTRADGTRQRFTVLSSEDLTRLGSDSAARKAHILAKLWMLANNSWPADKLTHDYALALGMPSGNRPFAVEVEAKGHFKIRYDLGSSPLMCWCMYEWKAQTSR